MPRTSWMLLRRAERSWIARSRAARFSTEAMSRALPMAVATVSPKLPASAISSGVHSYGALWYSTRSATGLPRNTAGTKHSDLMPLAA